MTSFFFSKVFTIDIFRLDSFAAGVFTMYNVGCRLCFLDRTIFNRGHFWFPTIFQSGHFCLGLFHNGHFFRRSIVHFAMNVFCFQRLFFLPEIFPSGRCFRRRRVKRFRPKRLWFPLPLARGRYGRLTLRRRRLIGLTRSFRRVSSGDR